jgi:hypothetical protein
MPNFELLDTNRPDIARLLTAMVQAREAVDKRSWSHPQELASEDWWADVSGHRHAVFTVAWMRPAPQPSRLRMAWMPRPWAWRRRIASSVAPDVLRRPMCLPCALARASPACTRSLSMARSNSANKPDIWSKARPEGVELSMCCWWRYKSTPKAWKSAKSSML